MKSFFARRYDTEEHVRVTVGADGAIESVETLADPPTGTTHPASSAAALPLIVPGLFDLQVNGHGGREFSSADLSVEDVQRIAGAMAAQGIARFLPTVTTAAVPVLEHALATIAAAMVSESTNANGARIEGIHLEGPFLSAEDGPRGAHPAEHCQPPCWELFHRLQDAAAGKIRLLTMAVEFPHAPEFIRKATTSGVIVAIGHTAASGEQISAAVDAGARLSTHLGNGAHPILPRHPNYIWSQLAEDLLWASLIADGFHLPPEVLKTIVRAKSPERCLLISDMSGFAGMPPGRYQTGLGEIELLPSGKLVIAGQETLLAAASMPLTRGIANVAQHAGVTRQQAIEMASLLPAKLLGMPAAYLEIGAPADFTLLDWAKGESSDVKVRGTVVGGELAYHVAT